MTQGSLRILLLSAGLLLQWSTAGLSFAQTCPPAPNAIGSCSSRVVTTLADFPFATTVIGSEQTVVVADFIAGAFYKYDALDIAATPPTVFIAPLGAVQVTGVAWHPTSDELYWVMETGSTDRWVRSTLDGALISNTPITGYLADFAGLTWNPGTGTFWTLDFLSDTYIELDLSGAFTGNSFQVPSAAPFGGLAFGLGITAVDDPIHGWHLDVPLGTPADLRAARVERVTPTGDLVGLSYDLGPANDAIGWITGIAWGPVGSTGGPVTFLVDLTENRLIEVPTPDPAAFSVSNLSCTGDSSNQVALSWTNGSVYNSIAVERDGVMIASLSGNTISFTDIGVADGTVEYRIEPLITGSGLAPVACEVVLGPGLALASAPFDGAGAFGVTVIESLNRIAVTELTAGTALFYDKNLVPDGTVLTSPFTGGDATTGIAWNSTDDTLLWHSGDTGGLQKTELTGALVGAGFSLNPIPAGPTGDISYSPLTGTYFGVLFDTQEVFEFDDQGLVLGTCPAPLVDGGVAGSSRGVAVANFGGAEVLDQTVGPASRGLVDRVVRLADCQMLGSSYDVQPTTGAGVIAGIAFTPVGSSGLPSEYLIGFDTNRIYEVAVADLTPVADLFRRGDVNNDSAVDISDPTALLGVLFLASTTLTCEDAADANDDGSIDIADAIELLTFLFIGGVTLPEPLICGSDPTIDALGCDDYPDCL